MAVSSRLLGKGEESKQLMVDLYVDLLLKPGGSQGACDAFMPSMQRYVDRQLSDADASRLEWHLETCSSCATIVEEMFDTRPMLESPARPISEPIATRCGRWWFAWPREKTRAYSLRLAMAAVFLSALAGFILTFAKPERTRPVRSRRDGHGVSVALRPHVTVPEGVVVALPAAAEIDSNIEVPEPTSILLLGTGLLSVVGFARRRRSRRT